LLPQYVKLISRGVFPRDRRFLKVETLLGCLVMALSFNFYVVEWGVNVRVAFEYIKV